MMCNSCVKSIRAALEGVAGVDLAIVDLESGTAVVTGTGVDPAALVSAVEDMGKEAAVIGAAPAVAVDLAVAAGSADGGDGTMHLSVGGMMCGKCVDNVLAAMRVVPGVSAGARPCFHRSSH